MSFPPPCLTGDGRVEPGDGHAVDWLRRRHGVMVMAVLVIEVTVMNALLSVSPVRLRFGHRLPV